MASANSRRLHCSSYSPFATAIRHFTIRAFCLDAARHHPHPCCVSRLDGRRANAERRVREESPGSMDMRCRITSGGRKPGKVPQRTDRRGALRIAAARVKRCGKSAPRRRQRRRHGKPHREQDRIGTARGFPRKRGMLRDPCPDPAVRVGCLRRRATGVAEEWPSRGAQALPYRTRLTGRLIFRGLGGKSRRAPANFTDVLAFARAERALTCSCSCMRRSPPGLRRRSSSTTRR